MGTGVVGTLVCGRLMDGGYAITLERSISERARSRNRRH
jgi:hypothetical protein